MKDKRTQQAGNQDEDQQGAVRVTDRRRVYLDPEGAEPTGTEIEEPNLKPKYVEELEARTLARKNRCRKCKPDLINCANSSSGRLMKQGSV
jgi:hypothetical protein